MRTSASPSHPSLVCTKQHIKQKTLSWLIHTSERKRKITITNSFFLLTFDFAARSFLLYYKKRIQYNTIYVKFQCSHDRENVIDVFKYGDIMIPITTTFNRWLAKRSKIRQGWVTLLGSAQPKWLVVRDARPFIANRPVSFLVDMLIKVKVCIFILLATNISSWGNEAVERVFVDWCQSRCIIVRCCASHKATLVHSAPTVHTHPLYTHVLKCFFFFGLSRQTLTGKEVGSSYLLMDTRHSFGD